jgi:serum/glucocorticoid-regulated kinase 2
MSEKDAKFYFVEILLGIQYLHENKIIYRDIKPENLLIGPDGHTLIADFGLAKPNIDNKTVSYSFCGSPEYMAPEMLSRSGHSFTIDYYCIGALLYELVTGLPPFYSKNHE